MPISVTYTMSEPDRSLYAYSLKAVASSQDMDPRIFVFHRDDLRMPCGDAVDSFVNVASPVDLDEIPQNEPDIARGMPFYRANEVSLWFRSVQDRDEARAEMASEIDILVKTLAALDVASETQTETYGG